MLVRRTEPVAFECVVRGYLVGLGLGGVHASSGTLAGEPLPRGLLESGGWSRRSSRPPPRRSRATTSTSPSAPWRRRSAPSWPAGCGTRASRVYRAGRDHAAARGIIIADTKFEFGSRCRRHPAADRRGADSRLLPVLARRALSAGASPAQLRQAAAARLSGRAQSARASGTAKRPRRRCQTEVVSATSARYLEAYRLLTGPRAGGFAHDPDGAGGRAGSSPVPG